MEKVTLNHGIELTLIKAAQKDAVLFQEEFPGDTDIGDWDATAFEFIKFEQELTPSEYSEAWHLYARLLQAEVERIAPKYAGATKTMSEEEFDDLF